MKRANRPLTGSSLDRPVGQILLIDDGGAHRRYLDRCLGEKLILLRRGQFFRSARFPPICRLTLNAMSARSLVS